MKVGKYTIDEVKALLKAVGRPIAADVSERDSERQGITDEYIDWVEKSYNHTNYAKENQKVLGQANKYLAALRNEEWSTTDQKKTLDNRNSLIEDNVYYRSQLGLDQVWVDEDTELADRAENEVITYLMDPITKKDIQVGLDFDEVRAVGGSSYPENKDLAYPFIDFTNIRNRMKSHSDPDKEGPDHCRVPDITEQQYQKWVDELTKFVNSRDVAGLRGKSQQVDRQHKQTDKAVDAYIKEWPKKSEEILRLKTQILWQRLIGFQTRNLKQNNGDLRTDINKLAGGYVTEGKEDSGPNYDE